MHFWRRNSCLRDAEKAKSTSLFLLFFRMSFLSHFRTVVMQRFWLFVVIHERPLSAVDSTGGGAAMLVGSDWAETWLYTSR